MIYTSRVIQAQNNHYQLTTLISTLILHLNVPCHLFTSFCSIFSNGLFTQFKDEKEQKISKLFADAIQATTQSPLQRVFMYQNHFKCRIVIRIRRLSTYYVLNDVRTDDYIMIMILCRNKKLNKIRKTEL